MENPKDVHSKNYNMLAFVMYTLFFPFYSWFFTHCELWVKGKRASIVHYLLNTRQTIVHCTSYTLELRTKRAKSHRHLLKGYKEKFIVFSIHCLYTLKIIEKWAVLTDAVLPVKQSFVHSPFNLEGAFAVRCKCRFKIYIYILHTIYIYKVLQTTKKPHKTYPLLVTFVITTDFDT